MKTKLSIGEVTIDITRQELTDDGLGFKSVVVGKQTGQVYIEVNLTSHELRHLARRSLRNKTRKSTLAGGAIVIGVEADTLRRTYFDNNTNDSN